jgi:hypothetical protein
MADILATGCKYHMFDEEPETCAESLYSVLESLFKARNKIAALEAMRNAKNPLNKRRA